MCLWACLCAGMSVRGVLRVGLCMFVCLCISAFVCLSVCSHVYISVCVSVYLCKRRNRGERREMMGRPRGESVNKA